MILTIKTIGAACATMPASKIELFMILSFKVLINV
jgi:hypothetical protein